MDIILSVEIRKTDVYGWLLTQKLKIDWFSIDFEQEYEILSS